MPAREPASDDVETPAGTIVAGKYRIERLLGKGGMGAVYAAQNTAIGKRVALKFLSRTAAEHKDAARRFQREAQAASLIESEHIVQVFDAGTSAEGLPFLVMEHLTGEDLRARLTRDGKLPIADALDIVTQLLRGLVRAHAAGIVHRDLKPDNVFLCARDGGALLVKLVDFGISKLERATLSERLTRRGTVLGSAHYMSPEQAQASDDVDQRADLYGAGAILFEMLTGRPPHGGPTLESVLVAICTQTAADVRSLRPEVSPALAAVVSRALARDRTERFPDATAFLAALSNGRARTSPGEGRSARSRLLVAGTVATLVGFTLTAALVARRSAPRSLAGTPSTRAVVSTTLEPTTTTAPAIPRTSPPVEVLPLPAGARSAAASATSAAAPAPPASGPSPTNKSVERPRRLAGRPPHDGVASSLGLSNREP